MGSVADVAAGQQRQQMDTRRQRGRRRRLGVLLAAQPLLLLLANLGNSVVQARWQHAPAFVAGRGPAPETRQEREPQARSRGPFPTARTRWGQPLVADGVASPSAGRRVWLVVSSAAASGEEGEKPKRGRPRKNPAAGEAAGSASATSKKTTKKAATKGEEEALAGTEEGEEEEVEYEYDEESLPPEMRELLRRPSKGLAELLEEAGIEFGDPSLMDDVVESGGGPEGFRAGFVTIVGSPNVGKSTLMNALVGERVSIVTSKQQTTRHQIMGVVTGEDFQIVYYDTPGVLRPDYKLQEGMMAFVKESLGDADVVLLMTDVFEDPGAWSDQEVFQQLQQSKRPLLLAVNKVDVLPNETHPLGRLGKEALKKVGTLEDVVGRWQALLPRAEVVPISALEGINLEGLLGAIKAQLPVGPPLYPNDTLTDKPQRFFASEMIREKIFLSFSKEIPYSCEVAVTGFKDQERLLKMNATIYTTRESHVPILIGTKGNKLKEVGTLARKDLEAFFGKKVYLELRVKVRKDWRQNLKDLKSFGYVGEE